jgi:hypothetical protein
MDTNFLLATVAVLCYNITIVAGTVYMIQFYDWNPWWFLLALMLMKDIKRKGEGK